MEKKCEEIRNLLNFYLDNALSSEENEMVANHLGSCENCKKELALLQKTSHLIKGLHKVKAPDGFAAKMRTKFEKEEKASWWDFFTPRSPVTFSLTRQVGLVFAVLMIVVVAGYWLSQEGKIEETGRIAQAPKKIMEAPESKSELAEGEYKADKSALPYAENDYRAGRKRDSDSSTLDEVTTVGKLSSGEEEQYGFADKSPADSVAGSRDEKSLKKFKTMATPETEPETRRKQPAVEKLASKPAPPPAVAQPATSPVSAPLEEKPVSSMELQKSEAKDNEQYASEKADVFERKSKEEASREDIAQEPHLVRSKPAGAEAPPPAESTEKNEQAEETIAVTGYPAVDTSKTAGDDTDANRAEQKKAGKLAELEKAQEGTVQPKLRAMKRMDVPATPQLYNLSKEEIILPVHQYNKQPREVILLLLFDDVGKIAEATLMNELNDDVLEKNIIDEVKNYNWKELLKKYGIPGGTYRMKCMLDEEGLHLIEATGE